MLDPYTSSIQEQIHGLWGSISIDDLERFIIVVSSLGVREKESSMVTLPMPHTLARMDRGKLFFKRMQPVRTMRYFEDKLQRIEPPRKYEKQEFPVIRPVFESIEKEVRKEAREKIRSLKFWSLSSLRDDYVGDNTYPRYKQALEDWEQKKAEYEAHEGERIEAFAMKEKERYEAERAVVYDEIHAFTSPSPDQVFCRVKDALSQVQLPYALSIAFAHLGYDLYLDVLYPSKNELTESEFYYNPETLTEGNLQYLTALLGSAYIMASYLFNIADPVRSIIIVGHGPVWNASKYVTTDETLYAVHFDRDSFQDEFSSIHRFRPYENITKFQNILSTSGVRFVLYPIKIKSTKARIHEVLDSNQFQFMYMTIKESNSL